METKKKLVASSVALEKRLLAVEIVERMGSKITEAVLDEVRRVLELPELDKSNLRRWFWSYRNVKRYSLPASDRGRIVVPREAYTQDGQMVTFDPNQRKIAVIDENNEFRRINITKVAEEARQKADELYARITEVYLESALKPEKMMFMSGKEMIQAATLAYDRIAKRTTELPEAIATLIPLIMQALNERGLDPYTVFYQMLVNLREIDSSEASTA